MFIVCYQVKTANNDPDSVFALFSSKIAKSQSKVILTNVLKVGNWKHESSCLKYTLCLSRKGIVSASGVFYAFWKCECLYPSSIIHSAAGAQCVLSVLTIFDLHTFSFGIPHLFISLFVLTTFLSLFPYLSLTISVLLTDVFHTKNIMFFWLS